MSDDRPTVELFRVFLAHDVEASRDRRVDADREVVVDDVARYRVSLLVPLLAPVRRVVVLRLAVRRRRRIAAAAVAVAVGDGRRGGGRRRVQRWRAELDVPPIQHHDRASSHAVNDLAQLLALVTCRTHRPAQPSCRTRHILPVLPTSSSFSFFLFQRIFTA